LATATLDEKAEVKLAIASQSSNKQSMAMPPITGAFYENSKKIGAVLRASQLSPSEIRQFGQKTVLEKRERYKIIITGTFVFHGMRMADVPENIYEVDSDTIRLRVYVESAKPIGGESEILTPLTDRMRLRQHNAT
jgi:hypothetical protein